VGKSVSEGLFCIDIGHTTLTQYSVYGSVMAGVDFDAFYATATLLTIILLPACSSALDWKGDRRIGISPIMHHILLVFPPVGLVA